MVYRVEGVAKYICSTCDANSLEQREHQTSSRRVPLVPSSAYNTNTLLHDSASCSLGQGKAGDTFSTNLLVCYADCVVRDDGSVVLHQSLCRLQLTCCQQRAAKFNMLW